MTNTLIGIALFAVLLTLAPVAAAEADRENTPSSEHPDDAAWVEDCPPDMMCAYSSPDDGNVTRGEECAFCRDHQEQECIDCLGAPAADDDTTWGTDCPPEVFCMGSGGAEEPDDAGWVDCDGEVCAYDAAPETGRVKEGNGSALFFAFGAVALVGVAFVAALRDD